jgi:monoamine oxidase
MPLSRRAALASLAGLAATPAFARKSKKEAPPAKPIADVDVAIIGAGAAGIAAARRLIAAGRKIVLVEASDRVGGRARTDQALFGSPVDLGAHWMRAGATNPLAAMAKAQGYGLDAATDAVRLDISGRAADEAALAAFEASYAAMDEAISAAGEAGRDVAAASVLPKADEWSLTAGFVIGPYEAAVDLDQMSTLDYANGEDGEDVFVRAGYGAVVANAAAGLPVKLSTFVSEVDWSGKTVRLKTPAGTIQAQVAIITVSTGVLASGRIAFRPALPDATLAAIAALPMGTYNRIILEVPNDPYRLGADASVLFKLDNPNALGLLANVGGGPLWFADVGGRFGKELEEESDLVTAAWAKDFLANRFGADLLKKIGRTHVTHWGLEGSMLGAYSAATPGGADQRAALAAPIGDRLFFAGEATSRTAFATVHGAWREGERAAEAALAKLT